MSSRFLVHVVTATCALTLACCNEDKERKSRMKEADGGGPIADGEEPPDEDGGEDQDEDDGAGGMAISDLNPACHSSTDWLKERYDGTLLHCNDGVKVFWQKATAIKAATWDVASETCSKLTLAGYRWRLPSIEELESVAFNTAFGRPFIASPFYETTDRAEYWSSTPDPNSSAKVLVWHYGTADDWRGDVKTSRHHARCVSQPK